MVVRANPEKKEEKERVRHALFRAALRLAATHGFTSLGLREVAREADIAPTSFYRHFADMEELGVSLVDEVVGPTFLALLPLPSPGKPVDAPELAVRAVFGLVDVDPELVRFVVAERVGGSAAMRRALHERVERLRGDLDALVVASGAVRPADGGARATATRAMIAVLLDGAFAALEAPRAEEAAHRASTLTALRTILAGATRPPRSPA